MSKFTLPSITAFSTAALITFGGVYFGPTIGPKATSPTTDVPVVLLQQQTGKIADGEVTTRIFNVSGTGTAARTGQEVAVTDDPSFTARLPNGQYLLKSEPTAASKLANHHDTDETAPVPQGAGCKDRQGCTWIWVDNSKENDTWGIMQSSSQTHERLEFMFDRTTLNSDGVPVAQPATAPTPGKSVQVLPPPPPRPAPPMNLNATPAPVAEPQSEFELLVTELINGTDVAMENVTVLVIVEDPATRHRQVYSAVTGTAGYADLTTRPGTFTVIPIPPADYSIESQSHPPRSSIAADGFEAVSIRMQRVQQAHTRPAGGAATPSPNTAGTATTGGSTTPTSPAPGTSQPPADEPVTSTVTTTVPEPATPTPASSTPATTTTTPTTTETSVPPTTVAEAPATTVPPITEVPQPPLGCDETNDPELAALLGVDDGAIRWISGGELHTVYPEDGMSPIQVCEAAYQRLIDMGFDSSCFTLG